MPGASGWLTYVRSALVASDDDVVWLFLRPGLPLWVLQPRSRPLCDEDMENYSNHPLGCVRLHRSGNKLTNSCQNGLARYAASNLCLVHVTPKFEEFNVPDLDVVLAPRRCWWIRVQTRWLLLSEEMWRVLRVRP